MTSPYTVDASVFINAFNPYEAGHGESSRLMAYLREQAIPIIAPTLLLPEVAGAIARGGGDSQVALEFHSALTRLPHLNLIPLDPALARVAADTAAQYRLRGSDAVYVAVALRYGALLVTLDREQRGRVASSVDAQSPAEACVQLGI